VTDVREHRSRPSAQVIMLREHERVAIFAPMMEHRLHRLRRASLLEGEARLSTADIDAMIDWTQEMRGKTAAERAAPSPMPHEHTRP
jgi:hypothetical protein